MARYNKLQSILASITLLYYPSYLLAEVPLSQGTTEFSATILEGSCDWTWNEIQLDFLPVTVDRIKSGTALEIKPLTAAIQCTQALTPQLKITGSTPFADNAKVFLDAPVARNVGFMLQVDDGRQQAPSLGSFFSDGMAGKAIENNVPINVTSVTQANQSIEQIIWIGLVGMNSNNPTETGSFSSTLIFTGLIP